MEKHRPNSAIDNETSGEAEAAEFNQKLNYGRLDDINLEGPNPKEMNCFNKIPESYLGILNLNNFNREEYLRKGNELINLWKDYLASNQLDPAGIVVPSSSPES